MKLSWGTGIFVFIVLFMLFMLTLVYLCTKQSFDLVSDNYYEQELLYQRQVDRKQNSADLKEKLTVNYEKVKQAVEIQYPSSTDAKKLSGDIVFFKPDDSKLDFTVNINPDQPSRLNRDPSSGGLSQLISSSKLAKGLWRLKISWSAAGTSYYQEEKILIN
jgi:hypothetical protein